ncbi:MAG: CheB methylesterase domain-containing protein [Thermoguttaceae bacterium]|jgi:two-component system chemotaxis response regulator CheB
MGRIEQDPPACLPVVEPHTRAARTRPLVVALGVSTGGPQALKRVLPKLPEDLPVPVLVVQHMPPVFTRTLADNLARQCALQVCEASDGQIVEPGWVLIAPGGMQMKIERCNCEIVVRITDDPPERSCKPSVDYLFRSVVEVFGGNAVGVLMTGMGADGVNGCRLLRQRGAKIVAQDEASCVVYGMPRELVEQGLADLVVPLDEIADEIIRLTWR